MKIKDKRANGQKVARRIAAWCDEQPKRRSWLPREWASPKTARQLDQLGERTLAEVDELLSLVERQRTDGYIVGPQVFKIRERAESDAVVTRARGTRRERADEAGERAARDQEQLIERLAEARSAAQVQALSNATTRQERRDARAGFSAWCRKAKQLKLVREVEAAVMPLRGASIARKPKPAPRDWSPNPIEEAIGLPERVAQVVTFGCVTGCSGHNSGVAALRCAKRERLTLEPWRVDPLRPRLKPRNWGWPQTLHVRPPSR